jgi:hypothetical protein
MYIGYTEKPLQCRFKQHKHLAKMQQGYFLHNAIRKYGEEYFTIESICNTNCLNDIREKEIKHIITNNSIAPYGYNIHRGGLGGDTLTNHPDLKNIKKTMSEKHLLSQVRGKDHPRYIQYSEDIRSQVVEMYFSFKMFSPQQIIKKYNISSKDTFNRIIFESNHKLYRSLIKRFKVNKDNLQKLRKLYFVDKKTVREISQLTNLAEGSICKIIKEEFQTETGDKKKLHQQKSTAKEVDFLGTNLYNTIC